MSNKQNKKIRQLARRKVRVEAGDVAKSLQGLILKFGFSKRLSIAWKILRKQPFLHGTEAEQQ